MTTPWWHLHSGYMRLLHACSTSVTATRCRDLLTDLGPCFIKAGQVLANRPDIIRQDYMDELCVLQDDVPSFPDDEAFEIIEKNLGRPMEQVLSAISERPIAAASLGQVSPRQPRHCPPPPPPSNTAPAALPRLCVRIQHRLASTVPPTIARPQHRAAGGCTRRGICGGCRAPQARSPC